MPYKRQSRRTRDRGSPTQEPYRDVSGYRAIARFFVFMVLAFLAALAVRSFLIAPFVIPSESMEPNLLVGDYVIAAKWNYRLPLRSTEPLPERGDIVIFDGAEGRQHYVKRVIGLPGDRIEMQSGLLRINGVAARRVRTEDFVLPVTNSMRHAAELARVSACLVAQYERIGRHGQRQCRFRSYRETLPGSARSYTTLDLLDGMNGDTVEPIIIPKGHLFVMGDNRDRSADSRLPPGRRSGIGFVPIDRVAGRAAFIIFSVDGSAQIGKPGSWIGSVRWKRIGKSLG